ncbi:hypothetical protein [Trueperella abortisuis]|uniref:Glycosyltransferase family 2 protein n=1 Tax=Trueperella abortisuis TaxID=445930 RepID=A0ABT9PLS1_9ACTO|nr:hypothetical protein [Trueperella abortisuis]MDP9832880.1 hypothetical protein [Trueperella abortisuis]
MKLATLVYKGKRAVWHVRSSGRGAVKEFFRRRRLVRRGPNPRYTRGRQFPEWPIPAPVSQLDTRVALIAPDSIATALNFEWCQTLLRLQDWQRQIHDPADVLVVTSSSYKLPISEFIPSILASFQSRGIKRILWIDEPTEIDEAILDQFDVISDMEPAVQPMIHNPQALTRNGRVAPRKRGTPIAVLHNLPYRETLSAYRSFRLFFESETKLPDCLDRVRMEILSCNADVIPTGEDRDPLDSMWRAYVARQEYWLTSTYRHRARALLSSVGLADPDLPHIAVTPLIATNRPHQLPHVLDYLAAQRGVELQPIISTHGFEATSRHRMLATERGLDVIWLQHRSDLSLGEIYNLMIDRADTPLIAKMDDDDYYDSTYLLDSAITRLHSGAELVGKRASFVYVEGMAATYFCFGADENKFVHEIAGPTLLCDTQIAREIGFSPLSRGEDSDFLKRVTAEGASIYAGSRFGFLRVRAQQHTWNVPHSVFTSNGMQVHSGGPSQLELPGIFGVISSLPR